LNSDLTNLHSPAKSNLTPKSKLPTELRIDSKPVKQTVLDNNSAVRSGGDGFEADAGRCRSTVLEGQHLTSETNPTLGPRGAIVAATGLVHNDPVVTNDSDFESVDGLTVERY